MVDHIVIGAETEQTSAHVIRDAAIEDNRFSAGGLVNDLAQFCDVVVFAIVEKASPSTGGVADFEQLISPHSIFHSFTLLNIKQDGCVRRLFAVLRGDISAVE